MSMEFSRQRVGQTEQLNNNNSVQLYDHVGFPGGSDGKESACNVGDVGSIPGLGRSPGEGIGSSILGLPLWLSS